MTTYAVLDHEELERGYAVGNARADRAARRGYTRNVHTSANNHQNHRESAAAELAVATWLGAEWVDDINAFRSKPDILPDIEVRRVRRHDWPLIIYGPSADGRNQGDHRERRFILTFGTNGTYELLGWAFGYEAVVPWVDTYKTGTQAWVIQQRGLRRLSTFVGAPPVEDDILQVTGTEFDALRHLMALGAALDSSAPQSVIDWNDALDEE